MDKDFNSPQEYLLNLQNQVEEDDEEEIDYFCIERNQVICEIVFEGQRHKFKVHLSCWENFELRDVSVVLRYEQNTQHLVLQCPFRGCAHCGENLLRAFDWHLCDTCVLLREL